MYNSAECIRVNNTKYYFTTSDFSLSSMYLYTPPELQPCEQYHLVDATLEILCDKAMSQSLLEKGVTFRLKSENKNLNKKWTLNLQDNRGIFSIFQKRISVDKPILEIKEASTSLFNCCFKDAIFDTIEDFANTTFTPISLQDTSWATLNFNDPFTQLATKCFQRCESWESSEKPIGTYEFILTSNKELTLQKINPQSFPQQEVIDLYKRFLQSEYGQFMVSFFEQICTKDSPLCPVHILQCNLRALTFKKDDINELHSKLQKAKETLAYTKLSARELRCLQRVINPKLSQIENIDYLLSADLTKILTPTSEELQRASTGKIISIN